MQHRLASYMEACPLHTQAEARRRKAKPSALASGLCLRSSSLLAEREAQALELQPPPALHQDEQSQNWGGGAGKAERAREAMARPPPDRWRLGRNDAGEEGREGGGRVLLKPP